MNIPDLNKIEKAAMSAGVSPELAKTIAQDAVHSYFQVQKTLKVRSLANLVKSLAVNMVDQVRKGGKPIGTISDRKDGKWKKVGDGAWEKQTQDTKKPDSTKPLAQATQPRNTEEFEKQMDEKYGEDWHLTPEEKKQRMDLMFSDRELEQDIKLSGKNPGYVSTSVNRDPIKDKEGKTTGYDVYNYIEKVFVKPDHRGQGEAKKLLQQKIDEIKKGPNKDLPIKLSAFQFGTGGLNTDALIHFYESMGFKKDANQGNPGDGVKMTYTK